MLESVENIGYKIYFVRRKRVVLDSDMALLFGIPTKRVNEKVHRNGRLFSSKDYFWVSAHEVENLRSQACASRAGDSMFEPQNETEKVSATSSLYAGGGTPSWGGYRRPPHVFTEEGFRKFSKILGDFRRDALNDR